MKRVFMLGIILFGAACSVYAQGFYFDVGLGFGKAWTKFNGIDLMDTFNSGGEKVDEIAVDIGLRAGYGPFGTMPIYVVGELGGIGHRMYDSSNYIQFNSYLIGPGILFYPISLIQLSAGIGYSYVSNQTDILGSTLYGSQGGFAWNAAAAVDLGKGNHGCLLGIQYFNAANKLILSNAEENSSMVSVFVRYTYRHKPFSGV